MRDRIEAQIGAQVDQRKPLLQWLISGAAFLVVRHCVGEDGRTPHQRIEQRRCLKALAVTGEVAHVRPVRHNERARTSEERWSKGVWLGVKRHAAETLVGTSEGVVRRKVGQKSSCGIQGYSHETDPEPCGRRCPRSNLSPG